jgi:hypothetical protein
MIFNDYTFKKGKQKMNTETKKSKIYPEVHLLKSKLEALE